MDLSKDDKRIKYKIINYKCKCKFIWFPDGFRHKTCPEHNRPSETYKLWCQRCGKIVIASAYAGYRQELCYDCRVIVQNEVSKQWSIDHPGYWQQRKKTGVNKPRKKKTTQKEVFDEFGGKKDDMQGRREANIIIAKCAAKIRNKYLPKRV